VAIALTTDRGLRVEVRPGSVSFASRTTRAQRSANRHCVSQILRRDPRGQSRATRLTAAWSTARSRAEADRSSWSLQLQPALKPSPAGCP